MKFWSIQRAEIVIRPPTPAHGTVWWYLTGLDPRRVISEVHGTVLFGVSTRHYRVIGSATLSRPAAGIDTVEQTP